MSLITQDIIIIIFQFSNFINVFKSSNLQYSWII